MKEESRKEIESLRTELEALKKSAEKNTADNTRERERAEAAESATTKPKINAGNPILSSFKTMLGLAAPSPAGWTLGRRVVDVWFFFMVLSA